MEKIEKIIKGVDAVLNCIPIVSTVNNGLQALYKLAHKVDAHNPVAPGLKTSIQIHVLSKENLDCFIEAIPIIGNLFALIKLVLSIFNGFDDDLTRAVVLNKTEIVDLCVGNNVLDDPERANEVLSQSAYSSNNETFKKILNSKDDWSSKSLIRALRGHSPATISADQEANANDILDFWTRIDTKEQPSLARSLENFIDNGKVDLVGRIPELLPKNTPFADIKDVLLKYSCSQYDYAGNITKSGVLTRELKNALIAKSAPPSLYDLKSYYNSFTYQQLGGKKTAADYRETHFDTLHQLLDLVKSPQTLGEFILSCAKSAELDFTESLLTRYEEKLTTESKVKILTALLPSETSKEALFAKRTQLFTLWTDKWKDEVSAQAHELFTNISKAHSQLLMFLGEENSDSRKWLQNSYEEDYIRNLLAVNATFAKILLSTFPGCDQALQEALN